MRKTAALFLLVCAAFAQGQRTSTLGRVEREISYQISVGGNSSLVGSGYGEQTGTLRALSFGQRRELAGALDLRIDGWVIRRKPSAGGFNFIGSRYDAATGRSYTQELTSSWLLAGVIGGSLPIHLPLDLIVDPMVGLGIVPIAYGRLVEVSEGPSGESSDRSASNTSRGIMFAAGASLRWHHIVIEQHFLQVAGADKSLYNGENAPLMIGWRF